jgi:hypothetical protein
MRGMCGFVGCVDNTFLRRMTDRSVHAGQDDQGDDLNGPDLAPAVGVRVMRLQQGKTGVFIPAAKRGT